LRPLFISGALLGTNTPALAYRPFVSTDAAVADPGVMEIEFGYFQVARQHHGEVFSIPRVVLNYGLVDRLEIVGEFAVEQAPRESWQFVDPGLFLKAILKEGILQEKAGVGVAVEIGPLLPSTIRGENGLGAEAFAIVSGRLNPFTYHVNAGGGVDRTDARPFALWGLIVEMPVAPTFRLVGEVNGESVAAERPSKLRAPRVHLATFAKERSVGRRRYPSGPHALRAGLGGHPRGDLRLPDEPGRAPLTAWTGRSFPARRVVLSTVRLHHSRRNGRRR